jgi:hypothetical protein
VAWKEKTFATIKSIESSTDNALENFGNIQFAMHNAFSKLLEKLRIVGKEEKQLGFSKSENPTARIPSSACVYTPSATSEPSG